MGRRRPRKRPPTPSEPEDEAALEEEKASLLPVGAEVEVRIDDPGFEGSFFEATVAGHLISSDGGGGHCYTLAYSTLLSEEGGLLREIAAAADVRPRPPPEENAGAVRREFAICEMVEAFHNDGWWAGVVSAVPAPVTGNRPRGAYKVTFPTSRETMEFEETALRPDRVFQDGRWVPAAEVDNVSPLFSEGNRIEVSQSAENFSESWSPATVLKVIGAHFLVQYIHIEKNGELATEIVDSEYIRPARLVTSMGSRHRFSPSSHVEVLHQGSWWPGVIVEVSCSGIDKKYVVKLKKQKEDSEDMDCVGELMVENTKLRPRYDWDGKKWVLWIEEKPAKGPPLTARKRPIYAALALHDEGDGSRRDKKLKKADVVSESISLMSVSEKCEINHMSSYTEETMEQQNVVLALASQLPPPSLPPMTALGYLSSSSLAPSCHLEQSSETIILPYRPQGPYLGTRSHNSDRSKIVLPEQEKQSTVGSRTDLSRQKDECVAFQTPDALGESTETRKKGMAGKTTEDDDDIIAIFEDLAQLPDDMSSSSLAPSCHLEQSSETIVLPYRPQGPYLGTRSRNSDRSKIVLPDQEKQSTVGSRTDLSRQKDECVAFQTPDALGESTETRKKGMAGKTIEDDDDIIAIFEDLAQLPDDMSSSSLAPRCHLEQSSETIVLPYRPQGPYLGTRSRNSDQSKIVLHDQEKQSTVGSRTDLSRQKDECVAFQTPDALGESTETRKKEMAGKTIEEDDDIIAIFEDLAQLPDDMIAGCEILSEMNKVTSCIDLTPRKDITGMSTDDANVHSLPSEKSFGTVAHGDHLCMDNAADMAEWLTGYVAPAKDLSIVSSATLDGAVPKPLQLSVKFEVIESHTEPEVYSNSSQSMEKSTVIRLPSVGMDNCSETEPGNSLEGTQMSQYVASRTHHSCCSLSPESVDVHESVVGMNGLLSESLAAQHLPFVKTSPIWAQLEALEIFRKVPQRPNFRLVQQHLPDLREGSALGLMVSFASFAACIDRLEVQDDNGPLEQKMLGLSLMEANGFDVRDLRSRLETLLHARNSRRAVLQEAMQKLEQKIAHEEAEDRELGAQFPKLAMSVHHLELELHTYLMRDVMQSAISQKMDNAMKISRLKTEANELERSYVSITAAPP